MRYRPPGQVRGSPQSAIIPGEVADPQAAATALEVALGPVEAVQIVETFYRPSASAVVAPATVVEDASEPAPLVVPFPVPPHVHVLDVAEAWAVGPDRLEHWNLHSGHDCLMPPELGRDVQLAVNIGHPTSFAAPPTAPIPLQQDTFLPQALWADDNAAAASRPSGSRLICEHCRHFHRDPGPSGCTGAGGAADAWSNASPASAGGTAPCGSQSRTRPQRPWRREPYHLIEMWMAARPRESNVTGARVTAHLARPRLPELHAPPARQAQALERDPGIGMMQLSVEDCLSGSSFARKT